VSDVLIALHVLVDLCNIQDFWRDKKVLCMYLKLWQCKMNMKLFSAC